MLGTSILTQDLTNTPNSSFSILSEGLHPAIIVGLVVTEMKKYESEENEPKLSFIWQVKGEAHSDDDTESETIYRYVKSRLYTISTNEKSALMKDLMVWAKTKSVGELLDKLKDHETGKFQLKLLLGKKASVTITHEEYNGNQYEKILMMNSMKKSLNFDFDPQYEVPAFIHKPKSLLESVFLDDVKLAQEKKQTNPTKSELTPSSSQSDIVNELTSEEDDSLPF